MISSADFIRPLPFGAGCVGTSPVQSGRGPLRVSDTHRQRRVGQISWPPLGNFLSVSGPVSAVHRHKLVAVWLCKVAERQLLSRSFVPPPPRRVLRDLTRYRVAVSYTHLTLPT